MLYKDTQGSTLICTELAAIDSGPYSTSAEQHLMCVIDPTVPVVEARLCEVNESCQSTYFTARQDDFEPS